MDIQHQLVQFPKNFKSELVQISLFWQIWTSPDLAIFEILTNSEMDIQHQLVQIRKKCQIWTNPDLIFGES